MPLGVLVPGLAWAQTDGDAAPAATDSAPAAAAPAPGPGSQYYVEPPAGGEPAAPPPGAAAPPPQGVYEPPPPGQYVYEPPPPPKPHHRAPKTALWLGARFGWFLPFGGLWAQRQTNDALDMVKWSQFASSGPMFELDVGARLGRYYNVYLLWERASLGGGSEDVPTIGQSQSGETDYYAIGLRFSSDPDKVGFLTDLSLGYRRFRAQWDDGTELQLTEAPLEMRIGLGADIRLTKAFSLSPLLTLGAGSFGSAEWVAPDGTRTDATTPGDERAGHGWLTLQLGGHFDIGE